MRGAGAVERMQVGGCLPKCCAQVHACGGCYEEGVCGGVMIDKVMLARKLIMGRCGCLLEFCAQLHVCCDCCGGGGGG